MILKKGWLLNCKDIDDEVVTAIDLHDTPMPDFNRYIQPTLFLILILGIMNSK